MNKLVCFFILSFISLQTRLFAEIYNVRDFGAKGDSTLCTSAIQKAIDFASENGGGHILVPSGKYLSGPLFLASNIVFEISAGATIYYSDNISETPVIDGSWEGINRKVYASLFTGHDLKNVTITGKGCIDGQGIKWWDAFWITDKMRVEAGIREREPENPEGSPLKYPRPRVINLYRCENVEISGLSITNSPSWTIHPVYCNNVCISGISIKQPYESPNTDGINPESCNGVRISNCYIDCGDDCITLKSGYNEHGRAMAIPCENVVIANCTFAHGRSAIGIGSEMSGGVRNVSIMNCIMKGTLRGLRVKTGRGRGGVVQNLLANGLIMENIREGISIDMGYEGVSDKLYSVTEETPFFRNIRYSNIIGNNIEQAINIIGLQEAPPEDIVLENIRLECKQGLVAKNINGLKLKDVELISSDNETLFRIQNGSNVQLDNIVYKQLPVNHPFVDLSAVNGVVLMNTLSQIDERGWLLRLNDCKGFATLNNLLYNSLITQ